MSRAEYSGIIGTGAYALYRLRAATGHLLYIGVSGDIVTRLYQHSQDKRWWPLVHKQSVTVEWFDTAEQAGDAELVAIAAEQPMFNAVGVTRPAAKYTPRGPSVRASMSAVRPDFDQPRIRPRVAIRYSPELGV